MIKQERSGRRLEAHRAVFPTPTASRSCSTSSPGRRPREHGYDPTASSASNLGPESIVDTLPDPTAPKDSAEAAGKPSLLTQVCSRSLAIGQLEGVSGARPFCTADGVGAVLAVFYGEPNYRGTDHPRRQPEPGRHANPSSLKYSGVKVECATVRPGLLQRPGRADPRQRTGQAGRAADAVTASGSGLDPEISPAYASLQEERPSPRPAASASPGGRAGGQVPDWAGPWASWVSPR